jgi:hypothetical protein
MERSHASVGYGAMLQRPLRDTAYAERHGASRRSELLAGCPPDRLGAAAPSSVKASKLTATVLRRDGFLSATPRPCDHAMAPRALGRSPPHTGSAPVRTTGVGRHCSPLASKEGHSPCLQAGALWPVFGRPHTLAAQRAARQTWPPAPDSSRWPHSPSDQLPTPSM